MVSICSFESRRAEEMKALIEKQGGQATIAPSMQEIPLDDHHEVLEFAEGFFKGEFDIVIFMTGVGANHLLSIIESKYSREEFFEALKKCTIIVRGPKPVAVMKTWNMDPDYKAPTPNTWKEVLQIIDEKKIPVANKRIAVQEYGVSNPEFYEELRKRQAEVQPVTVYRWALPDDPEPLYQSVRDTIDGDFDVLLFTSANQLTNVLRAAEDLNLKEDWLQAVQKLMIASIGPTASEKILLEGLHVDLLCVFNDSVSS